MKQQEHERHLQLFAMQFLNAQNSHHQNDTIEDLMPSEATGSVVNVESRSSVKKNEPHEKSHGSTVTQKRVFEEEQKVDTRLRLYIFDVRITILQTVLAYFIFLILLLIESKSRFPIFDCYLSVPLFYLLTPFKKTNLMLPLLGIPISICNNYLNARILTYPSLLIIYLSLFLFNQRYKMSILWVLNMVILSSYGFLTIPAIYEELPVKSKYVFYYLFPLIHYLVKLFLALSHHSIKHSNDALLQFPLYLLGVQYGVLLTLNTSSLEFWYLMIILTMQVVDDNFQVTFRVVKRIFRAVKQNNRWVLTGKCSAHVCLNTLHIFILVYCVCGLRLTSLFYNVSLFSYIEGANWSTNLVIWVFFWMYEVMCLIQLRDRENMFVMGEKSYSRGDVLRRTGCLVFGFWLFYLGLCLPHSIFF